MKSEAAERRRRPPQRSTASLQSHWTHVCVCVFMCVIMYMYVQCAGGGGEVGRWGRLWGSQSLTFNLNAHKSRHEQQLRSAASFCSPRFLLQINNTTQRIQLLSVWSSSAQLHHQVRSLFVIRSGFWTPGRKLRISWSHWESLVMSDLYREQQLPQTDSTALIKSARFSPKYGTTTLD